MKNAGLVMGLLLLVACSTTEGPAPLGDQKDTVEELLPDATSPEVIIKHDVQDVAAEQLDFDTTNGEDVVSPLQCDPGEGCFLDKCDENTDCQSGWCVQHLGEGVCTQTCQDECPAGWTCQQVAGTDPDLVYVCVSAHANLCRPCTTNDNCTSVGGANDACMAYGPGGSFCGSPCGADDSCPWGFTCKEKPTVDGTLLMQCIADAGECPCTKNSVALGLMTPCSITNEFGICEGKRTCGDTGLSDCDAATPVVESCNGMDNDCDGDVDEPELVGGKYYELCDDGNDCTEDTCAGGEGCVNEVLDAGTCDDGNPCTVADHCETGTCVGTPVQCDDQNPCTDNVCTETGGCDFPPNTEACDDGNPCTLADQCVDGACVGTDVPCDCLADADCAVLEDDDLCNGMLVCDTAALPYKCVVDVATVVTCPEPEGDNAFCLQAACDPANGTCATVPFHGGFLCDNGDACTVTDKCADGECTGGVAVNCNDGNACTDDACDPVAGCTHTPNVAACNDGDLCTLGDQCADGICVGGPAADCEDGNACTQDTCTPDAGCQHTVTDGPCDDGDVCTSNDLCIEGVCQGSGVLACTDNDPCTDNACDPATGCVVKLNQALCDDSDVCTVGDHCHLGECIHSGVFTCNDGNVCTNDSCDPAAGCTFAANQAVCEDNNLCTEGDVCAGGWCIPGFVVECTDENECTTDSCDPAGGCINDTKEDGTLCSDENPQGVCLGGKCVCNPACVGKKCGDDGCGGSCGECGEESLCIAAQCEWGVLECGGIACSPLAGYEVTCNAQDHCEYANGDETGWKEWDVWIWIPPGTFPMGSADDESGHQLTEGPLHNVTFEHGYLISKYEIVVEQYEACRAVNPGKCTATSTADWDGNGWGTNSSANNRANHPQNGLTWQQAKDYCGWTAPGGRLPSEAEWEYAAKGPVDRKYPWGDSPQPTCANNTAMFNEEGGEDGFGCGQGGTSEAGSKTAGASWSGALDMSGNLWEWCEDWYHDTYSGAPSDGSAWLEPLGLTRAARGGGFNSGASLMRLAQRNNSAAPDYHSASVGVRCVRPSPNCQPLCQDKDCGDDGCGGSCGTCSGGKVCQGGACVCEAEHHQACAGGKLYWHDSCNVQGSLVNSCDDGNACTTDGCSVSQCTHSNVQNDTPCGNQKTCQSGSCTYKCGDGVCASTPPGTETCCTCAGDCGSCCGNGACDCGETKQTCPGDCGSVVTAGFVKVNKGSFWMGVPSGCPGPAGYAGACASELGQNSNETLHYVKLTHDFELQVHEVTQGEWKAAFGGWNPSYFPQCGDNCPVEYISWYDSCAYANWKSEQVGLTPCYVFSGAKCEDGSSPGNYKGCLTGTRKGIDSATVLLAGGASKPYACMGFRLPTEAEWEVAARAGSQTAFYPSDGNNGSITQTGKKPLDPNLNQIGWYGGNSHATYGGAYNCSGWYAGSTTCGPQPFGGKEANAWGLKDMSGNVWEWCSDWYVGYGSGTQAAPDEDPYGESGSYRVLRGGGWNNSAKYCRSAFRVSLSPGSRSSDLGARLARSL